MKAVLTFAIVLLIWRIVKFPIEAAVGKDIVNKFAGITKPAFVFNCLPCGRGIVARRVIGEVVADGKTFPAKLAIRC